MKYSDIDPYPGMQCAQMHMYIKGPSGKPAIPKQDIQTIAKLTEGEDMVHLDETKIKGHPLSVILKMGGELCGHAAVTVNYSSYLEFGGLVLAEEYRGKRMGQYLTEKTIAKAKSTFPNVSIIAFANSKSGPVFDKAGGVVLENAVQLPKAVFDLCEGCGCEKPEGWSAIANGCMDTIYCLDNVKDSEQEAMDEYRVYVQSFR